MAQEKKALEFNYYGVRIHHLFVVWEFTPPRAI
jgi:hypothetical protein